MKRLEVNFIHVEEQQAANHSGQTSLIYSMHRFGLHQYQNPTLCTSPYEFAATVQYPGDRPNLDGEGLCPLAPMMKESMLKKVVVSENKFDDIIGGV